MTFNILTLTHPDLDAMETEAVESVRAQAHAIVRKQHYAGRRDGYAKWQKAFVLRGACDKVLADRKATGASTNGCRGVMETLGDVP